MTFSLSDAFIEYGDVFGPPMGMAALTNDDVGGPFEILVGLLSEPSVAGLAAAAQFASVGLNHYCHWEKNMPRSSRRNDELIEASNHFKYELWMFKGLVDELAAGTNGRSVIGNALLESFTIHARVLLDFLYSEPKQKDDVIAEDFIEKPERWIEERPTKSDLLAGVHRRVGKEVAHLTYARQDVTPETRPWHYAAIASEVEEAMSCFLNLVPLELLGSRWSKYKHEKRMQDNSI